ncbi:MAG: methyltransferase family protein [Omnitrophica WOR_2 bacterium]
MNIKGLDQLRKHIPDFNNPLGILRLLLFPILSFFLAAALLTAAGLIRPVLTLVVAILLDGLTFFLLYLFVHYRKDFIARFGSLAYSKAASRLAYPAVAIISAVVARIRSIPGPGFPHFWGDTVLPVLGWALIASGLLLFLRTIQIFGVDNLVMLYVYFPAESRLVEHRIYHILRHPAYATAQLIAFGLALLNGNWLALACALIFALSLWGWVRLVEEQELIERFGRDYIEYRQHVPAFWPRLRDLRALFGFLISGK